MKTKRLGGSAIEVSVVGLGCNNFGYMSAGASAEVIHRALDLGVTFFDTADAYGLGVSEENVGRALGARRKDIVIATKFGLPMGEGKAGASPRYVVEACEASLRRLGTDWVDLYQIHRPDPSTQIEDTMAALNALVEAGKLRAIGCSNHAANSIVSANAAARRADSATFVAAQDELSLLERGAEKALLPTLRGEGISLIPYFPLASGMLTGKYRRDVEPDAELKGARLASVPNLANKYMTPANWDIVEALSAYAAERGRSLLELAFGWLAAKPEVASVIAGATKLAQIEANVAAATGWTLTPEEASAVDAIAAKA